MFSVLFFFFFFYIFHVKPYFLGKIAYAYSVDPDQTPQNAASDQGLHCLTLIQHYLSRQMKGSKYFFKF